MSPDARVDEAFCRWRTLREAGQDVSAVDIAGDDADLARELLDRIAAAALIDEALREDRSVPERLGPYEILGEIGRGGMGVVYEAEHVPMRRRVALKVLFPALTAGAGSVERFRQEAWIAGRLDHRSLVTIHDLGHEGDLWYYAMELVPGRPLDRAVRGLREGTGDDLPLGDRPRGNLAWYARLSETFAEVADALDLCHREGVVHRDVKPSNLIVTPEGRLVLLDFGLARLLDSSQSVTSTGEVVGTPLYMSPEQASGASTEVDARTDVYSLGATLYEVLTLDAPFRGDTPQQTADLVARRDPVNPRRIDPRIPRDLETILLKSLEKSRQRRYATAADLARDLRAFAEGLPIQARPLGPVGRALRGVRRRPWRTAGVAALAGASVLAGAFALLAHGESSRRATLEYERLLGEAFGLIRWGDDSSPQWEATDVYSRAISILPSRPEAWLNRGLLRSRAVQDALSDLEASRNRGLHEPTYRAARAAVLWRARRLEESRRELALAERSGSSDAEALSLMGHAHYLFGRPAEAMARLGAAARLAPPNSRVQRRVLMVRGILNLEQGNAAAALEDVLALSALGSRAEPSPEVELLAAAAWEALGKREVAEGVVDRVIDACLQDGTPRPWSEACAACERGSSDWIRQRIVRAGLHAFPDHMDLCVLRLRSLPIGEIPPEADRILALDPSSHGALCVKAGAVEDLGRHEEALAIYEQAAATDDRCAQCWSGRGIALANLGRTEDAVRHFEAALGRYPYHETAAHTLAELQLRAGAPQRALDVLQPLVDVHRATGRTHTLRMRALTSLHRTDEMLAAARDAVAAEPDDENARVNLANKLQAVGNYVEAGDVLAPVKAALEGEGLVALWVRMQVRSGSRDLAGALADADEILRRDPGFAAGWFQRGVFHAWAGRLEESLRDSQEALRLLDLPWKPRLAGEEDFLRVVFPSRAQAQSHVASALVRMKRFAEALEVADAAQREDPADGGARVNRGAALNGLGKSEEAIEAYRSALRLEPRSVAAHAQLGKLLWRKGEREKAWEHADAAVACPDRTSEAFNLRGVLLVERGDMRAAAADFRAALDLDPNVAEDWLNLGQCLRAAGEGQAAVAAFRRAAALDPRDGEARYLVGDGLLGVGENEEALPWLQEAVRLPGRERLRRLSLGAALMNLGRYEEARREFVRTIELEDARASPALREKTRAYLGRVLAWLGRGPEALEFLGQVEGTSLLDRTLSAFVRSTCPRVTPEQAATAVDLAKRSTEEAPDWAQAWVVLGAAHCRAQEWAKAGRALRKAMQRGAAEDPLTNVLFALARSRLDAR